MPNALSSLERRILDFIVDYLRRNTYQPSVREIARRFGIKSTKTVSEYLQSLADKGWIERDPARSRGVRVIGLAMSGDTVSVPRYDRLTTKNETPVSALELDKTLVGSGGTYIVALGTDEGAPDGMQAGDLLIVEPLPAEELEDGDLAVLRTPRGAGVVEWTSAARNGNHVVNGRVLSLIRRVRQPTSEAANSAR